jgi:hypothetical protein
MEEMEEVWKEVFLMESEGKADEAASHQAKAMSEIKERYDARKAAFEAYLGGSHDDDE